jgi:hypothetical protein
MYKLRRLHLDTIGVPENRFSSLTLDTLDPEGDPADTVIWMRNGSGKTTIMSLLTAHILPGRRDFLAGRKRRHRDAVTRTLEDLVQGDDTAHVVAEWEAPGGGPLLTGAVWEWAGRRRPLDYNKAGNVKLKRLSWVMRPDPAIEGTTFEDLPLTSRTRGAVDLDDFHGWIRQRAADGADAVAVAMDDIKGWHRVLQARGFDAGLYRYFVEINATEGGIDALFADIHSENDFAHYLLGFVTDTTRAADVRELLHEVSAELAQRPGYLTQREFCIDARPRLTALGSAHDAVVAALTYRDNTDTIAAGFRLGLLQMESRAKELASSTAQALDEAEKETTRLKTAATAAGRRRSEYQRIAASHWVTDAKSALAGARTQHQQARVLTRAWDAIPMLLRMQQCQVDVKVHRQAIDSARNDTKTVEARARVRQAEADLAATLDNELRGVADELETLQIRAAELMDQQQTTADIREAAVTQEATLVSESEQLGQQIAVLTAKRSRAVAAGILAAEQDPDKAAEETLSQVAALGEEISSLETDIEGAQAEKQRTQNAWSEAADRQQEAKATAGNAAATLMALEQRAAPLNRSESVTRLAQTNEPDVLVDAESIAALANEEAATTGQRLLENGVDSSGLQLAVSALAENFVLPPRPAVRQVLTVLEQDGIAAVPGWSYLAQNLTPEHALALLREEPEICDGIIVYSDLETAVAHAAELRLDDPVVLSHVSVFSRSSRPELQARATNQDQALLEPVPARYDTEAGETELLLRRELLEERTRDANQLRSRRDELLRIVSDLRALAGEVSRHGGAVAVREKVEETSRLLAAADSVVASADQQNNYAQGILEGLVQRGDELRKQSARLTDLAERRHELALDLEPLDPAIRRLDEIPDLLTQVRERAARAKSDLETIGADLLGTARTKTLLDRQHEELATDREVLRAEASQGSVPVGGLDAARRFLTKARDLFEEAFDEPELARRLRELEGSLEDATSGWNVFDGPVQEKARLLVDEAGSSDPALRSHRRSEAAVAENRSATQLAGCDLDLQNAEKELRERRPPSDRQRHADVTDEPDTRAEADEAADREDKTAAELNLKAWTAEQRSQKLEREHIAYGTRARESGLRGARFSHWSDIQATPTAIPDDTDALDLALEQVLDDAQKASSDLAEAQKRRTRVLDELRHWAASDQFASALTDDQTVPRLRKLFLDQPAETIAPRAEDLGSDLDQRRSRIEQHLEHLELTQRNVATRLVDLVNAALSDLAKFSRLSRLPESIGPWGGHEFVQVAPRSGRPGVEQATVRVTDLIRQMVSGGTSLDISPEDLVWRATEAAVGVSGFRARILKPDPAQPTAKVGVTEMNKWSGGENLTACLVLFCVMVKLRAENRGRQLDLGVAGGLVPLDNPLGKANYVPFLQLQRTVAAASGVQLLFFTGIGDLPAIRAFGTILACSKRRSQTTPRAYVTLDDAQTPTTGESVQGIRLSRRSDGGEGK